MSQEYPKCNPLNNAPSGNVLGEFKESTIESTMDGDYVLSCENSVTIPRVANRKRGKESVIGKEKIPHMMVDTLPDARDNEVGRFPVSEEIRDRSLIVYDLQTGRRYGVLDNCENCQLVEWCDGVHILEFDRENQEIRNWKDGNWTYEHPEVQWLDLDANGNRWEGSSCNHKPHGYGVLYSEEGKKVYKGFIMNSIRIGYGVEYYDDIERVKYKGCFRNDKYFGIGTLYDRHGIVEYQGLWKNDRPYSTPFDGMTIDNHTESVTIPSNAFNEVESLVLPSFLYSLRIIVIGEECFGSVRTFAVNGLGELECVTIGKKSFAAGKKDQFIGSCQVENCPKLKSIQIGDHSFENYGSFHLSDLPSLQSIQIGDNCFYVAHSFSITGMITEWNESFRSSSVAVYQTGRLLVLPLSFSCVCE